MQNTARMSLFKIIENGKQIDSVYFPDNTTAQEVKASLIARDFYDESITVIKAKIQERVI